MASAFTKATADKATAVVTRNNEQKVSRNPPRVIVASPVIPHDLSIFIVISFSGLAFFDSSLEVILGRSPVPSENFVPRYKENGCNAVFRPQIARYYG